MFLSATRKSWRNTTHVANARPDRESRSYRAGRALGQLARGRKPTKYTEPATPNPFVGKKNVANISAVKEGKRVEFAYDQDTADLYAVNYGFTSDQGKVKQPTGGIRYTKIANVKEYQPVSYGIQHGPAGTTRNEAIKGRKYSGLDAVVKGLRDDSADVYVLDKTPAKQKKASTIGGTPDWRSPLQPYGEFVDPRLRHEMPLGVNPFDPAAPTRKANEARNMFWRRAGAASDPEKRAREVMGRGTAQDTIAKVRGIQPPPQQPPSGGPTGPAPKGPSGPGGPIKPVMGQGRFKWGKNGPASQTGTPPNPSGPSGPPPGQTPGPQPSQNQAGTPAPQAQTQPAKPSVTGFTEGFAGLGNAMREGLLDMLWGKHQKGDTTEAGKPSNILIALRKMSNAGVPVSRDNIGEIVMEIDGALEEHRSGKIDARGMTEKLNQIARTRSGSGQNSASASQPPSPPAPPGPPPSSNPGGTAVAPPTPTGTPQPETPEKPIIPYGGGNAPYPNVVIPKTPWRSIDFDQGAAGVPKPLPKHVRPDEEAQSLVDQYVASTNKPDVTIDPSILGDTVDTTPPPSTSVPTTTQTTNVGAFKGKVAKPAFPRADVYEAENRLQSEFHRKDMKNLANSGRNAPYVLNENVARDIMTAHEGDAFGLNNAFQSEELTTPEGFQVHPDTISVLAKALSDTEQARLGHVVKNPENPFAYSTQTGPDTLPFGTEGDMTIQGRLGIAERLIQKIDSERSTNPRLKPEEYDRAIDQVLIDQAAPAKVLMQQRNFRAAANEARAKGNTELAKQIDSFADEIADEADRRSPKMLDAFSTYREDTGTLMRGSYLSTPHQDVSKLKVMDRPDFARFIPEFAATEPKRSDFPTKKAYDQAIKKWTLGAINTGRSGIADFDAKRKMIEDKITLKQPLTEDESKFYLFARQNDINEANLGFSRATGQGGGDPADTKMFNTVAMSSPVPWSKGRAERLSQIPPSLYEDDIADMQFNRELNDPSLGNRAGDYQFQPEKFSTSEDVPLEDQIAQSLAGRFGSVSRYGASLGFASNAVDAARNRELLQGQEGEEGYGPQGTAKHWSSLGTVEKQLEAIQGGGKVPGMSEVHDATYAATFPEYQAKARDFVATLPPGMTDSQISEAANQFIRAEFNARLQSDYERLTNPESDTTGGHNVFRMPNTKTMIRDDPAKATLQQVFDNAIPGIVTPQNGDSYDAWNARLQQNQADTNVQNAYAMVDDGIREKARSFYADTSQSMSPEIQLAAERFHGGRDETSYKDLMPPEALPPKLDLEYPQNTVPEVAPAPTRMGLRKPTGRTPEARMWRQGKTRGEMNPSETFSDTKRIATTKQGNRQMRDLFKQGDWRKKPGYRENANPNTIHADQLMIGDQLSFEDPAKKRSKQVFDVGEVVDIDPPTGIVTIQDGDKYGTIYMDPEDPATSQIRYVDHMRTPRKVSHDSLLEQLRALKARSQTPPEVNPPESTNPAPVTSGKKSGKRGGTVGINSEAMDNLHGSIIQQIVQGTIKIKAKSEADKAARKRGLKYAAGYDNAGAVGSSWSNKIFSKDGMTPDEAHAHFVENGQMSPDSTPDDMFDLIGKGINAYYGQVEQINNRKVAEKQRGNVFRDIYGYYPESGKSNKQIRAAVAVDPAELMVGSELEFVISKGKDKGKVETGRVTDIDEDNNVTIEDGDAYGEFTVEPGRAIYAKSVKHPNPEDAGPDPWDSPAQPGYMPDPEELLRKFREHQRDKRRNPDVPF